MTRALAVINFVGVVALALLCAVQWRGGNQMARDIATLQITNQHQADTIDQQATTIKENTADLDEFRQRLNASESFLKDLQRQLAVMTGDRDSLAAARDQLQSQIVALKGALDKWEAAVKTDEAAIKDRDAMLRQANDQLQTLAAQRNDAVNKYNDLVNQYNALAKQIKGN
jgi:chromosome segregation ATPase